MDKTRIGRQKNSLGHVRDAGKISHDRAMLKVHPCMDNLLFVAKNVLADG